MAPPRSRRAPPGTLTASAVKKLRVSHLQAECRSRGLSAAGNRADLIERLRPFFGQPPPRPQPPSRSRRSTNQPRDPSPGSSREDDEHHGDVEPRNLFRSSSPSASASSDPSDSGGDDPPPEDPDAGPAFERSLDDDQWSALSDDSSIPDDDPYASDDSRRASSSAPRRPRSRERDRSRPRPRQASPPPRSRSDDRGRRHTQARPGRSTDRGRARRQRSPDRSGRAADHFDRPVDRRPRDKHRRHSSGRDPPRSFPVPPAKTFSGAPEHVEVVFLDNNPRAFGMRVCLAMETSGSARLAAPLPVAEVRRYEDQRLQLQARFSNLAAVPPLVDALLLLDDAVSWAAAYFRDTAAAASSKRLARVADRRLQQSKGLDDGARKVKEMASALAGPDVAVQGTYLKWAIAGILGFSTSSETEKILKEARQTHPRHVPAPAPPAYYASPPPPYAAYAPPPADPRTFMTPPRAAPPPVAQPPPPPPAPLPPPPPPPPVGGPPAFVPPAPARGRGIGRVVPACMSVIGTNVPYAINSAGKSCYLCGQQGHLAFSCYLSAPVRLGEPFHLWSSNTDISKACASLWIDYLARHQITGNPDPSNTTPLPDFAAVARG